MLIILLVAIRVVDKVVVDACKDFDRAMQAAQVKNADYALK